MCRTWALTVGIVLVAGNGCITDVATQSDRVQMQARTEPAPLMRLDQPVSLSLRQGFTVAGIHANSTWCETGTIIQGHLFRTTDSVLMVDAGHKYDAYMVVNAGNAVGVYLPGEMAFVAARQPVPISMTPISQ